MKSKKNKKITKSTTSCPPKQELKSESDSQIISRKSQKLNPTPSETSKMQKGLFDSCKGYFRDVCSVLCPGKNKPKKKTDSVRRCQSSPVMTQGRLGE